ncbi:glycosyl hydrolase catalytic core-domain-containing protein [Amylocarpus encephaloides]|uniref:Glycosyl hydrolase catalytic core-domain-containing protein n=1 Tax=Amylocarpus encephaloides TaxID=45428 RepID=A0A9P8C482_9HELO|nr:glycosyl hydrolase catalytic core-domain-containing protein [Amylocarpus encephaloides]
MKLATSIVLLTASSRATAQTQSSKRGLVFVPPDNPKFVHDNQVWVEASSDLSWYYNYQPSPSAAYSNRSQAEFEFVPMLWSPSDTFATTIQGLISGGRNITHVMGFNEPDGTVSTGGSSLDPVTAAKSWIEQIEPLRQMGIKAGAPGVTGSPRGFTWLNDFFSSCASQGTNCTADFFPVHWYGDFGGLASHMGQVYGTYNKSIWVTEYALNNQSLSVTQEFFNTSMEYFDRLAYVERYSYFGSFRSDVSNVGPNAAMLNGNGQLTDIGNWYLGRAAQGNLPTEGRAAGFKAGSKIALAVTVFAGWWAL